jgi:hypothetical protein
MIVVMITCLIDDDDHDNNNSDDGDDDRDNDDDDYDNMNGRWQRVLMYSCSSSPFSMVSDTRNGSKGLI